LAVCIGNIELAEEAAQNGSDVLPYLATVLRASERGAALTNQLLAFSRKQTLFPKIIKAGELLDGMTRLLNSALGGTIEINVLGNDDLWYCKVDPYQLKSAILNLALNARDAMGDGGTLTIEFKNITLDDDMAAPETESEAGEYVMVSVTDTGHGMSKEVLDHVFDPFFTTKEIGKGSGLGLSMVYGFVKQSGGHLNIDSETGKGTTIKLYLPRCYPAG
jgi:signal transduction histidine kinase